MAGWLIGNSTRRKTRRGIKRFITAWLSRKQDESGPGSSLSLRGSGPTQTSQTPVTHGRFQYEQL
jgi:hypothetical protein